MGIVQRTLTGEEATEEYTRPETFRYCNHCEEHILRTHFVPHLDHNRVAVKEKEVEFDGGAAADSPEKIGAFFDVTISYNADYRFKIPASTKHEAKRIAKEWHWGAHPADEIHLHTRVDEKSEIYDDHPDLPEDYDPFGRDPLHAVLGSDD